MKGLLEGKLHWDNANNNGQLYNDWVNDIINNCLFCVLYRTSTLDGIRVDTHSSYRALHVLCDGVHVCLHGWNGCTVYSVCTVRGGVHST